MTTGEEEFGKKIRTYLDQSSAELRSGVAYRLQQARAAAMARAAGQAETANARVLQGARGLAGIGGAGSQGIGERPLYGQPRVWLAIALLVAAMIGYQQWTAWQDLEELEDLDAQILTSDLPIDAYLDRGFQLWLKTGQPDE
jgi:hypothetical protein